MRFAVCLSLVPDPDTIEVDPLTGEIDSERTLHILDPADAAALETALCLRKVADTVTAFGNLMPSPAMERDFNDFHVRLNVNRILVGQGKSGLAAETLKQNGLVMTFCDLTTVAHNNAWLRFGRAETLVNLGPALLALKHDAEAMCLTFKSLEQGRHRITVHPPLNRPETADRELDARRMTQDALDLCSRELVERPEQWWQWDAVRFREPKQ